MKPLVAERLDAQTAWLPIEAGIVRRWDADWRVWHYVIEDTDGHAFGTLLPATIPQRALDAFAALDEAGPDVGDEAFERRRAKGVK